MEKITLCGDNCLYCPRYNAKTDDELAKTAELWYKVGWRNEVISNDEIKCDGCSSNKNCTYQLVECVKSHEVEKCSQCADFPCSKINDMLKRSDEYKKKCHEVCTEKEYSMLEKAFFNKEENLVIEMDKILTIFGYWDGVLCGLTTLNGKYHYCNRIFSYDIDEWTDLYFLTPVSEKDAKIMLANWNNWCDCADNGRITDYHKNRHEKLDMEKFSQNRSLCMKAEYKIYRRKNCSDKNMLICLKWIDATEELKNITSYTVASDT